MVNFFFQIHYIRLDGKQKVDIIYGTFRALASENSTAKTLSGHSFRDILSDDINDADTFGSLAPSKFYEIDTRPDSESEQKLNEYEENFIPLEQKTQGQFLLEIRDLLNAGKVCFLIIFLL